MLQHIGDASNQSGSCFTFLYEQEEDCIASINIIPVCFNWFLSSKYGYQAHATDISD